MKQANRPPNLLHLKRLSSSLGLIQHCDLDIPDLSFGYSIDDCARALIVIYQYFEIYHDSSVLPLASIYLSYIKRAKIEHGYFHNFADKDGKFTDSIGSETSSARAIWALGYVVSRREVSPSNAQLAEALLNDLPPITEIKFIRSMAYASIGYYYIGDISKVRFLADQLVSEYKKNINLNWFEDNIAYANAIMPFSLYLAYDLLRDKSYLEVATNSLFFLDRILRFDGTPSPIGHKGWKIGEDAKPVFDQQVIEAADMILAATAGKKITGEGKHDGLIKDWQGWFYGNNINHESLIDPITGGCYDGLTPAGKNLNMGAESTVCYLLAILAIANPNLVLSNHKRKKSA